MASCTEKKKASQKAVRSSSVLSNTRAQRVQSSKKCGYLLSCTSKAQTASPRFSDCSRAVYRDIYNQETRDISNTVAGLSKYIK